MKQVVEEKAGAVAKLQAPPTEELTTCPLCQGRNLVRLFAMTDRYYRLPGSFGLVRCTNCQLLCLSPRPVPAHIGFYYPADDYYSYQVPAEIAGLVPAETFSQRLKEEIRSSVLSTLGYPAPNLQLWARLARPLLTLLFKRKATYGYNFFPPYIHGGRALDVGCGSGLYLAALRKCGWQVAGVELSVTAAQSALDHWGIQVHTGPLTPNTFAPESFDYICLSDLIEHLPNPLETLKILTGFLKPGGLMFLQTPNETSFGFRYWQDVWFACETPRHLFLFSPTTLQRTLESAGLQITSIRTQPVLPGGYQTEFTYLYEATHPKELRSPRFQYGRGERWAAFKLLLQAYWSWWRSKLTGEVILCWATKSALARQLESATEGRFGGKG